MKTVIIGGVAGGATAAARLRRLDESAEIVVLERDNYVSYANCGMPYYIGDTIGDADDLLLQTPETLHRRLNLDIRVNSEVQSINRAEKLLTVKNLKDGSEYTETYDTLILAPGASAVRPPIPGADCGKVYYLRSMSDTLNIKDYLDENEPETAVVVGAGVIGLELAENLNRLGIEVTVVEKLDHVVPNLDRDVAQAVHAAMRKKGVNLVLGNGVQSIEETDDGLKIMLDVGELTADIAFMAVGVKPDSRLAADCGLEIGKRGAIVVNERMQTSDPSIYAVGDAVQVKNFVTGEQDWIALAGPANKQGRIAADSICGIDHTYKGTQGSFIMKMFRQTIACTGVNETQAKALGLDYDRAYLWSDNHPTYFPGNEKMNIKVLFEKKTGKLLGAQIVGGEGVDKRCDVLATAIRAGMTGMDLTELELCYAPPYSSPKDPVNMIGYVIENVITGKLKQVFWDEIDKMHEINAQFVDVRTMDDYCDGWIDDAINIPLAQLRSKLDKLDKSRPVFLYCVKGQNSYIAYRCLTQLGYDCYALAGGYHTWEYITDED